MYVDLFYLFTFCMIRLYAIELQMSSVNLHFLIDDAGEVSVLGRCVAEKRIRHRKSGKDEKAVPQGGEPGTGNQENRRKLCRREENQAQEIRKK